MLDCKGTYLVKDGRLFPTDSVEFLASDVILIYEVVRIIDSVCLFADEHFNRLKRSAKLAGVQLNLTSADFVSSIRQLVDANEQTSGNVKILLQYGNGQQSVFFYFISHVYPEVGMYEEGVKSEFLFAERMMPQAKIVQQKFRDQATDFIKQQTIFDAILVNSNGRILEGSSTNIFFVKGETFVTPPSDFVLSGITREKVMKCLHELSFPCQEISIPYSEIATYDAAFFTGTSPKVLPIAQIGEQKFAPDHKPLKLLMKSYDKKIDEYIKKAKETGL